MRHFYTFIFLVWGIQSGIMTVVSLVNGKSPVMGCISLVMALIAFGLAFFVWTCLWRSPKESKPTAADGKPGRCRGVDRFRRSLIRTG